MTRSASPNGAVEFSYDFPVAGPSHLRTPTTPTRTQRTRSPTRQRWENPSSYRDDEDDEIDYDAFGYPRGTHRAYTAPTPTGNQWRAPTPPLYPYADSYPYAYTSNPYAAPIPLILAPTSSSCESGESALSSCARSCHSQRSQKEKREHAKIRKPRRSVDSDSAPSSLTSASSSPQSSPYFSSFDDSFDSDADEDASPSSSFSDDEDEEDEKENASAPSSSVPGPHSLRRQWAALSLRVRFGVFRAKRKMLARVMSL